jgi:hypothetical protein
MAAGFRHLAQEAERLTTLLFRQPCNARCRLPCNLAAPMKRVRELDEIRSTATRTCYVVPITISPLASRLGLIFFNKELRG